PPVVFTQLSRPRVFSASRSSKAASTTVPKPSFSSGSRSRTIQSGFSHFGIVVPQPWSSIALCCASVPICSLSSTQSTCSPSIDACGSSGRPWPAWLLMEAVSGDAARTPDEHERPLLHERKHVRRDGVDVPHEIELREAALFVEHALGVGYLRR